jgi:glutamyl-tRNA synthetase
LFNWFEARHTGGVFLLRIEDTDASRTREEWIDAIGETLSWLGVDWDEAPVRQSTRSGEYLAAAEQLLASGHAYETFETPEELEAINEERKAAKLPPGYDGRGRDLTPEQRAALAAEGRPRTIRFRTPDTGTSSFADLIRGPVSVEWSTISDFVIVRSDGKPLFFLANAVDDIAMGITHVIRGEDLIDSTHRVLAIRSALGHTDQPEYAHLPLILRPDRAKLSKRHGAVAVEDFRARGILPEALLNYLALLGWSPGDDREVMTRDDIVAAFSLAHVTKSAAVFDEKKLEWMNGEWIRRLDLEELVARVRPLMSERYGARVTDDLLDAVVGIAQERATTLVSIVEQSDFLFADEENFSIDEDAWQRVVNAERGRDVLVAAIAHLEQCDWTVDAIDLRPAISGLGVKPGKVMFVLYAATEGRAAGLPVFDSIHLLGRERALERLRAARDRLG